MASWYLFVEVLWNKGDEVQGAQRVKRTGRKSAQNDLVVVEMGEMVNSSDEPGEQLGLD